jgi:hypothetical protein
MAREVTLGEMLLAIGENQPVATLILDPSLNSLTFFKYKGTLVDGREPIFPTRTMRVAAKHAITRGDTLAIFVKSDQTLQGFFSPTELLPETLVKTELTYEVLSIYKETPDDFITCDSEFKFVVIVQTEEVPAWANEFIDQGRLRVLRIVEG